MGLSSILIITMNEANEEGNGQRKQIHIHTVGWIAVCKKGVGPSGRSRHSGLGPDLIALSCWPHCVVAGLLFAAAASNTYTWGPHGDAHSHTRENLHTSIRGCIDRGTEEEDEDEEGGGEREKRGPIHGRSHE